MNITAAAISLNVADGEASATFAKTHFGFTVDMESDGFVSLSRPDAGFNLDIRRAEETGGTGRRRRGRTAP